GSQGVFVSGTRFTFNFQSGRWTNATTGARATEAEVTAVHAIAPRGAPIVRHVGGRQVLEGITNGAGGQLATRDAIPHMIEWLRLGGRRDVTVGSLEQAQRIRTALAPQARQAATYSENAGTAVWQIHPAEGPSLPHIRLWDGQGGSYHIFYSQ